MQVPNKESNYGLLDEETAGTHSRHSANTRCCEKERSRATSIMA